MKTLIVLGFLAVVVDHLVSCFVNTSKKFRRDLVVRLGAPRRRSSVTATRCSDVSRGKTPESFDSYLRDRTPGAGLYFVLAETGGRRRMGRALTPRIAPSSALVLAGIAAGIVQPHGVLGS